MIDGLAADHLKGCCANAYQHDLLRLLLGATYHPGGKALTRRAAQVLGIGPNDFVLDLASGPGTSAVLMAEEFHARVLGLDRAADLTSRAALDVALRGLSRQIRFMVADAESVPLGDACVDAVICECSFCTFPNKSRAAGEIARVLRSGGKAAVADLCLHPERLPNEFRSLAGWVSCLAGALPASQYCQVFTRAGLQVTAVENHDESLLQMIEQIDSRLRAADILGLRIAGFDLGAAREIAGMAREVIRAGDAGYSLIVAEKPAGTSSSGDA